MAGRRAGSRHAEAVADSADAEMEDLQHGKEQTQSTDGIHDEQEDRFLSRTRDEAIHRVRARRALAKVRWRHLQPIKNVLPKQERDLKDSTRQQLENVDLHQTIPLDATPAIVLLFGFLHNNFLFFFWLNLLLDHGIFLPVILRLFVVPVGTTAHYGHLLPVPGTVVVVVHAGDLVHSKAEVHDGWRGDHDHLEHPEADVRKRRKFIIAHVLTTRLRRVAHKFTLFIVVDGLAADRRQHDAEHDEEGEPDFTHKGGVIGNLIQQAREEAPAHFACGTGKQSILWGEKGNI